MDPEEEVFRENQRIFQEPSDSNITLGSENETSASESEEIIEWQVPERAKSEVWKIFKLDPARKGYAICRWTFEDGTICNQPLKYGRGGSTGPLGVHVNKHQEGNITVAKKKNIEQFFCSNSKKIKDYYFVAWLISNNRPFKVREDEGLAIFLNFLDKNYTIPSEPTMSKYRDFMYIQVQKETIERLKLSLSYHLTMDSWSKYNNYVGVMCHSLTQDWNLETFLLLVHDSGAISETHSYLEQIYKNATENLVQQEKTTVTVDGGTNYNKMANEADFIEGFRCSSHLIQNCVEKDTYAKDLRSKCNDVVSYFNSAKKAYAQFKVHQVIKGTNVHKFKTKNETRWYSDFMMIESVYNQIPALLIFSEVDFSITEEEQEDLADLVAFLGDIRNKFQIMERETECTISRVIPTIKSILDKLEIKMDNVESRLYFFYWNFNEQLAIKFQTIIDNKFYDAATFLDIRFKKLQRYEEFVALCKSILEDCGEVTQPLSNGPSQKKQKTHDSLLEEMLNETPTLSTNLDEEVHHYYNNISANVKMDPLQFWKPQDGYHRFPLLQKIASKILAIPATSSSAERLFSDGGNLVTNKRNGLLPFTVHKNLLIKKNYSQVENKLDFSKESIE